MNYTVVNATKCVFILGWFCDQSWSIKLTFIQEARRCDPSGAVCSVFRRCNLRCTPCLLAIRLCTTDPLFNFTHPSWSLHPLSVVVVFNELRQGCKKDTHTHIRTVTLGLWMRIATGPNCFSLLPLCLSPPYPAHGNRRGQSSEVPLLLIFRP